MGLTKARLLKHDLPVHGHGFHWRCLGNGQKAVLRLLFQKRELAEACTNLGEFCHKTQ